MLKLNQVIALTFFAGAAICCASAGKKIVLDGVLPGFWYFHEIDSSYAEIVMTENVYWAYDDRFGVVMYDYIVTEGDSVRRFYKGSTDPFGLFKVQKFTKDEIWCRNDSNFEFVLRRIEIDLDPDKVIAIGSSQADKYVEGYRGRKNFELKRNCREKYESKTLSPSDFSGLWQYDQPNGEYAEWVMIDKIFWTYSEGYGTWKFDYTLSADSLILWHSGAPYDTMIVARVAPDTLRFSNPKFACYRIKENLSMDKLIAEDNAAIDMYVNEFRKRSKQHQKK